MSAAAPQRRTGLWLSVAGVVLAVATLAMAIRIVGTPGEQRLRRLDDRRIDDLAAIEGAVRGYFREHKALPTDLATLARQPGSTLSVADPDDGRAYAYEPLGTQRFRLCAHFATDMARIPSEDWRAPEHWQHGAGRQCFVRDATKDKDGVVIEGLGSTSD